MLQIRRLFAVLFLTALGVAGSWGVDAQAQASRRRSSITFNKVIAPIVFAHCTTCHRPVQPGPFSLLTYSDVRQRAALIETVTGQRIMPPWKPEPGHRDFVDERRLSAEQIRLIHDWVEGGTPEGDPRDLPPTPVWPEGWQLGEPDLIVQMPVPYSLKASGPDELRNFVIPIPVNSRRFVKGIEFRPGNPRVVHHATLRIDQTHNSRRLDEEDPLPGYEGGLAPDARYPDGQFLAWTPGQLRPLAEDGLAWRLEAGSDLVMQLHLVPSGRAEAIQPAIGLFFSDSPPTRTPSMIRLSRRDIDIPAGQREYAVDDRYVLPVDVELRELQPHAHFLARRFEASAQLPDGSIQSLISIRDWDFRWQDVYRLKQPLRLPAGTALSMRITYDNSADNARNPFNPPERVRFGEKTTDEMGDLWLQVVASSRETLERDFARKSITDGIIGYEHKLEADPNNANLHESLGSYYLQLGRRDEALAQLDTSLRLNPGSAVGHYNLATAFLVLGQPTEAVVHFNEAVRLKPDFAYAHNSLGYALQSQGKIGDAIGHFRRAVAIDPAYAYAHNNLGRALQALGRMGLDEAVVHYQEAAAIRPDDPLPQRNWAKALAVQGNAREAIAHFRLALASSPGSPAMMAELAWLLAAYPDAAIRDPGEAIRLAEAAAASTSSQDSQILDILSVAHAAAGQFDQAIVAARSARALAAARKDDKLAAAIDEQLALYESHRSYVHDFSTGF